MIVIHIVQGSAESCVSIFKDPSVQKSSHFLVKEDGAIVQFVGTANTAYCNGIVNHPVSELVLDRLPLNPNLYTISIEHEGYAENDLTEAQYATTGKLVKYLHDKWNIPLNSTHIIRHREINGGKTCPGVMDVERILRIARG